MLVKQLKRLHYPHASSNVDDFVERTHNINPEVNITHIYFLPQHIKQVMPNVWFAFLISLLVQSQVQCLRPWKLLLFVIKHFI